MHVIKIEDEAPYSNFGPYANESHMHYAEIEEIKVDLNPYRSNASDDHYGVVLKNVGTFWLTEENYKKARRYFIK